MRRQPSNRFFHFFWKNLKEIATVIVSVTILLAILTAPAIAVGFVTYFVLAPRVGGNVAETTTMVVAIIVVMLTGIAAYSFAQAAEE